MDMEIKRDIYLQKLIDSKHNDMIKIITGMRRCGKSYLLLTLFYNHLKEAGVDDNHIIQVDLEDRRNKALRDPDTLLEYIDGKMTDSKMYSFWKNLFVMISRDVDILTHRLNITSLILVCEMPASISVSMR